MEDELFLCSYEDEKNNSSLPEPYKEFMAAYKFRIIQLYTGYNSLDDVLKSKKGLDLLWLEILVNDGIPWEDYLHILEINNAYQKACMRLQSAR